MGRPWTKEEDKLLKEVYRKALDDSLLSRFPERTKSAVHCRATRLGLTTRGDLWTKEEESILVKNYEGLTVEELCHLLPDRSRKTILNRASILGLTLPKGEKQRRTVNDFFFHLPDLENSYWAGLLAADGNISGNKIKISLKSDDVLHLDMFKKTVGSHSKIRNYKRTLPYGKQILSSSLAITSKQWVKDLWENYSITERKTYTLLPPPLKDQRSIFAFLIGLIDGDGSICYTSDHRLRLSFLGTEALMSWVKNVIDASWPSNNRYEVNVNKGKGLVWCLDYSGERAQRILFHLNSLGLPSLARKWDTIK